MRFCYALHSVYSPVVFVRTLKNSSVNIGFYMTQTNVGQTLSVCHYAYNITMLKYNKY